RGWSELPAVQRADPRSAAPQPAPGQGGTAQAPHRGESGGGGGGTVGAAAGEVVAAGAGVWVGVVREATSQPGETESTGSAVVAAAEVVEAGVEENARLGRSVVPTSSRPRSGHLRRPRRPR